MAWTIAKLAIEYLSKQMSVWPILEFYSSLQALFVNDYTFIYLKGLDFSK